MTTTTSSKPVSLRKVLCYRHPAVVRRYAKEHHTTIREAERIFREMLKWLYLCYRSNSGGHSGLALVMTPEIEKIDWMWHTFILFTCDYADFCEEHFGFFVHHTPVEDDGDEEVDMKAARNQIKAQFNLICDVLGTATLANWYDRCLFSAAGAEHVEN